jgi:lysophospholipid acyltransferase (LPLAT)-like uncharacterized protein
VTQHMEQARDSDARRRERRIAWMSRVGATLIRILGSTWRIRTVNESAYTAAHSRGRSVVLVLWHGTMLPLLYHHRGRRIAILISEHADGEIIARVAARLRLSLVRGSTSRGAARALVALGRSLESGYDVAITPDGPRGPSRSVAPGALVVAHRTGAPIVPLTVAVDRAWQLRTWDRFTIPKPFARITIAYGDPALVGGDSAREAAGEAAWLAGLMDDAERAATTS